MNIVGKTSDGIESLTSEEDEKISGQIEGAPTKRKPETQLPLLLWIHLWKMFPHRTHKPIRNLIGVDKLDINFDGNIDKLYIEDFIFRIEYMLKYNI